MDESSNPKCAFAPTNASLLTPEELSQKEAFDHFNKLMNGYLSALCVIGGTIGNLYGVRSIHSTNFDKNRGLVLAVSVLALAFWDTVLLWCAFFYYAVKLIEPVRTYWIDELNQITPCFHGFSQIANTASIWLVAAIMIQRFMAARDPFRSSSRSGAHLQSFRERRASSVTFFACHSNRKLLKMPVTLSILAILINFAAFFEIRTYVCWQLIDGFTILRHPLRTTDLRRDSRYQAFRTFSRMIFTTVGPMLLIIVFSIVTLILVRGSNRSRRQLFRMSDFLLDRCTSREQTRNYISFVLVGKCFVLRILPLVDIMELMTDFRAHYPIIYLVTVSNFLVLLNSATTCFIFLKASIWLNEKISERRTLRRKKTLPDNGQTSMNRVQTLSKTWEAAMALTNNQIGSNVLIAMTRKGPGVALLEQLRPPTFAPGGETTIVALIGLPAVKKSFDYMQHSKFNEVAERITAFIEELLLMMRNGLPENCIKLRIRRVGAVHHAKNIKIPSSLWKEFKCCLLHIISECEFSSDAEREHALDCWRTFISFIISEMKMGVLAINESCTVVPYNGSQSMQIPTPASIHHQDSRNRIQTQLKVQTSKCQIL